MNVKRSEFRNKIHLVLALLGVIPYLLTAYIFMQAHMSMTEGIMFMAAMILVFHLAGFQILRTFSDDLLDLVKSSTFTKQGKQRYKALPVYQQNTSEVVAIRTNFNTLLLKLDETQQKFDSVTIEILRESRKLFIEHERCLSELKPYVDPKIFKRIIDNVESHALGLHCEHRRVAVLFLDICSFTKLSENLPPEQVGIMLNEFFTVAVQVIYRHNGVVDKFIGDAVMAVFGLTTPLYKVSVDAVNAALDLQAASQDLMKKWTQEGRITFKVRVGINTGEVIAGNIGSQDRMDYTVIGDAVNVASRMVDQAAADEVVISGITYTNSKQYFDMMFKGSAHVKNRDAPIDCYTVLEKRKEAFQ
ncbi:MAG: adenylate/guanylate cyclase domain-containing protein [Mariprofundaceae bacterium]|nr:adenylate/guanylate cyclase domain-containing protein [Mariprofundaceae bacterium]